ncbi:hypothetical protein BJV82DRAFT_604446 [Fennellomyces sp. T-0311]|nr:hypothetical protein BJV82DRAFT_604446 [Fennellomyces sp. T-0311]
MPAAAKVSKLNHNMASFPSKLFNMLNDPTTNDLICWTESGTSFLITDPAELAKRVLPRYFKHDRYSSFVRQLNTYGFRKVPQLQQGVLQPDDSSCTLIEFTHPRFTRDQPDVLLQVQRKAPRNKQLVPAQPAPSVLDELAAIKKNQLSIRNELKCIQQENQAIWQAILDARARSQQHQDTIDKVLQFLASAVSSRGLRSNKRRLMIGEQQEIANIDSPAFDLNDLVEGKWLHFSLSDKSIKCYY